jgi:uncharacterized integral membrane protein
MSQIKLVIAGLLALCVLIIILQNTELVETRILLFSFTIPRAFLLFATFIVGFVVGALWVVRFSSKARR